jgi:hypothetical protein
VGNDVPILWFLNPSFWAFFVLLMIGLGIYRLFRRY